MLARPPYVLSRIFCVLLLLAVFAGCSDDKVTGSAPGTPPGPTDPTSPDSSVTEDTGDTGQVEPDGSTVTIPDDCDYGNDPACPCKFGELKRCSSYGDPLRIGGPTMRCQPGYQVCESGSWSTTCHGEVGPGEETCNGIDDDCDGVVDNDVRDHEGTCLLDDDYVPPREICGPLGEGTGFDDDGNGIIDDGCSCAVPVSDPDPSLYRQGQPCYSGPKSTLGVGICRAGVRDCRPDGIWGPCVGEVLPMEEEVCGDGEDNTCSGVVDDGCPRYRDTQPNGVLPRTDCQAEEICGDGLDNNCNGMVDEGCPCTGTEQRCYPGPAGTAGVGQCAWGMQYCLGEFWGACEGYVLPTPEQCGPNGLGNGEDNNCNGIVDDGCICFEGETRPCGSNTGSCEYGVQTCVQGQWSACEGGVGPAAEVCDGRDNDCNGIVDNHLRNACGTCDESCYIREVDPSVSGDTSEGTVATDAGDPDNPTGRPGVTLARNVFIPPYLWAANETHNTVTKYNTDTQQEEGIYWVATDPSRTAVDLDGNMWVGGRVDGRLTQVFWDVTSCRGPNTSRRIGGVLTQINSAANPMADDCVGYSAVPSRASIRGVATAPDGIVWFGFTSGGIQGINPRTYELTPIYETIAVPRYVSDANGIQVPELNADGTHRMGNAGGIYGLVVDSKGVLWTSSFNRDTLAKFNTVTRQWEALYTQFECGSYGIAVDARDRIWTGGWPGCPGVGMFDPATSRFHNFTVPNSVGPNPGETSGVEMNREIGLRCNDPGDPRRRFCTTGVAVEPATGDVWTSFYPIGYTGRLRVNENDLRQSRWTFIATSRDVNTNAYLPGVGPDLRGVGFDRNGYAWTLGLGSDRVWKIDPMTNQRAQSLPLGQSIGVGTHYTYSDFTGSTAFSFTAPRGLWRYYFDTGFPLAILDSITVEAYSPASTSVEVRVRTLNSQGSPVSEWQPAPQEGTARYYRYPNGVPRWTFDLRALDGPLQGSRFEVEVRLSTNDSTVRPILHDLELGWQRP
jgi:hypothetical protein